MIIVGYQGIGKSTVSGKNNCIDLESGNFWVDGKRDDEWYKPYCQIALHLHQQGYTVFTASHKVVRNYFKEIASEEDRECIFVCYPDTNLRFAWTHKLKERYEQTGLEKDFKAWRNADLWYDKNIEELGASGFKRIILETMQYDLAEEIENARKRCG